MDPDPKDISAAVNKHNFLKGTAHHITDKNFSSSPI
jgi:hypothetical protein